MTSMIEDDAAHRNAGGNPMTSTTETGTLAELNVGLGDVVRNHWTNTVFEIRERDPGVLALWILHEGRWGCSLADSESIYALVRRATPDNSDILNNTEAFGLMSKDKQRRMKEWPHGWVVLLKREWGKASNPAWIYDGVYRAKPAPASVRITGPVRITGTVQLDADGKPDFSTWEATQ